MGCGGREPLETIWSKLGLQSAVDLGIKGSTSPKVALKNPGPQRAMMRNETTQAESFISMRAGE